MEELQARHRKEQRDLQSRITQKKKQATKKTRKGVNDECANLERELEERQAQEIAALLGEPVDNADNDDNTAQPDQDTTTSSTPPSAVPETDHTIQPSEPLTAATENLAIDPADNAPKRKPNRQKARLARRAAEAEAASAAAAEEAASMPDRRKAERTALLEQFAARGLVEQIVRADGHCLYSALADQMESGGLGLEPRVRVATTSGRGTGGAAEASAADGKPDANKPQAYRAVRAAAADWIAAHADDFAPFLEEPLDAYVAKVRDTGEWGGHLELLALARSYGVVIKVLHADGRVDVIEPGMEGEVEAADGEKGQEGGRDGEGEGRELWLAYYRHGFGLGEHYNSLRKAK